jgi:hypothetical protein
VTATIPRSWFPAALSIVALSIACGDDGSGGTSDGSSGTTESSTSVTTTGPTTSTTDASSTTTDPSTTTTTGSTSGGTGSTTGSTGGSTGGEVTLPYFVSLDIEGVAVPFELVLDSNGDTVIAGTKDGVMGNVLGTNEAFVVKLDSELAQDWLATFQVFPLLNNFNSAAIDGNDDVIVAGRDVNASPFEAWLYKLDADGSTELLNFNFSLGANFTVTRAVTTDAMDNIIVGGQFGNQAFVRRYAPTSASPTIAPMVDWTVMIDLAPDGGIVRALDFDDDGLLWVAGDDYDGSQLDTFVGYIDPTAMTPAFTAAGTYDSGISDVVTGMVVTTEGVNTVVYVGGESDVSEAVDDTDAFVHKFDENGTVWTNPVVIEAAGEDMNTFYIEQLWELMLVEGNIVAIGNTTGDVGGTNAGAADVYVQAIQPDGTVLVTEQFGGAGGDRIYSAALRDDGNFVVVGQFEQTFMGVDGLVVGVVAPPEP